MYKIERKDFGYKLTFGNVISGKEMNQWLKESAEELKNAPETFGVFVDMRTLKPLTADAQEPMQDGQRLYKQEGMVRSVVILSNPIIKLQFRRIAKETGIYKWERYIDEETDPDWERKGMEWIVEAKDPDVV